jgi:hypothetical protein
MQKSIACYKAARQVRTPVPERSAFFQAIASAANVPQCRVFALEKYYFQFEKTRVLVKLLQKGYGHDPRQNDFFLTRTSSLKLSWTFVYVRSCQVIRKIKQLE